MCKRAVLRVQTANTLIDLGGDVSLLLGFRRDNMDSSNYTKTWVFPSFQDVQFLEHVQYLSVDRPLHYT